MIHFKKWKSICIHRMCYLKQSWCKSVPVIRGLMRVCILFETNQQVDDSRQFLVFLTYGILLPQNRNCYLGALFFLQEIPVSQNGLNKLNLWQTVMLFLFSLVCQKAILPSLCSHVFVFAFFLFLLFFSFCQNWIRWVIL